MSTVPTDPTRSNPTAAPVHVEPPHDPADADYDRLCLADAHLTTAAAALGVADLDGATVALADAVACLDALEEPGGMLGSRLLAAHLGLHALAAKERATKLAALVGAPTG